MLENVTSLYVSGSTDGETDFFLFAVDSLSVWEDYLLHHLQQSSLKLRLNSIVGLLCATVRLRSISR